MTKTQWKKKIIIKYEYVRKPFREQYRYKKLLTDKKSICELPPNLNPFFNAID